MPCYNAERYCEEAVRSILTQIYQNLELIAVDDGSTDQTGAILDRLAAEDDRLTVIHQGNGGIVLALNAALAISSGEYIARMDADDVSFPERIGIQVSHLDNNPECVLVGGVAVSFIDMIKSDNGTTGGRHVRTDLSVFPPRVAVSMHPLIMVRRSAMEEIGGYSSAYPHAEDYDLFLRLSALGTLDSLPEKMLFYRRHTGAISVRNLELQEDSAVNAELDAIRRAGIALPSGPTVESYRRLRKFRRYIDVDLREAGKLLPSMLAFTFNPWPPSLFSGGQRRLRLIAAFQIWRYLRKPGRLRARARHVGG